MNDAIEILSIPVQNVSMREATDFVFQCIEEGRAASIATANAEMLIKAREDEELARILQDADMVVPDGAGVLWAAEQQGKCFKERVAGVDLACSLMEAGAAKGTKVYFFGGAPGIAELAAANMEKVVGKLSVAGIHSGFFTAEEEKILLKTYETRVRRFSSSPWAYRSRKNGSASIGMNWDRAFAWVWEVPSTFSPGRYAGRLRGCRNTASNGFSACIKSRAELCVCWHCPSLSLP